MRFFLFLGVMNPLYAKEVVYNQAIIRNGVILQDFFLMLFLPDKFQI